MGIFSWLTATLVVAICSAQLDLTSCASTDLTCINARVRADQILLEIPNFVNYPITNDAFYNTPANFSKGKPGDILKLEVLSNTTNYDIPPGTALSRFMYVSVDQNNKNVPATGSILWPFTPKKFKGSASYPLVAWAHGTTGVARQCAVSNLRNLQYDFRSVFTLATNGYAVVIPDYAGLGTNTPFNYLAYKLHANDVAYSVVAAQSAFPQLSAEWVSFGHSEGGGVAWAVGERQAFAPVPGFLGTIAAAPPPFPIGTTAPVGNSVFTAFLSFTIAHLYGLNLNSIFRKVPYEALQAVIATGGCNDAGYAAFATFTPDQIYKNTSWPSSAPAVDFLRDYHVSGRALGGPMLIIQGTADTVVGYEGAVLGYNNTCTAQGKNVSIEFVSVVGQNHNPSMYASQSLWLQWIEDRFNGVKVATGCSMSNISSAFANVQLPERFLVEYEKPWITIFSSTFLPQADQAADLGFVPPNSTVY